ncbi:MAG: hypothetical protein CMH70_02180 [Nitrosomonadaceae bacterium]|nr:hypothetical protein [Nitrosomonadaceae bacterium]|tara:strand:+ start:14863 stop:16758 length:1896 start_codon:yes stop_codon:yes gene_type:complete
MVITGISIQNFKGFGEEQKIEFKPITLLFGANSSGKSTIIQALQYFGEILINGNVDADTTLWGGEAVSLGGFENLVYKKEKLKREITLRLDFDYWDTDVPEYIFPYLQDRDFPYLEDEVEDDPNSPNAILEEFFPGNNEQGWMEIEIAWSEIKEKPYLKSYEIGYGEEILGIIDSTPDLQNVQISFLNFNHPIFIGADSNQVLPDPDDDETSNFSQLMKESMNSDCFREGTFFPIKIKYNNVLEKYNSFNNTDMPRNFEEFLIEHPALAISNPKQNNLDALNTEGNQVNISLMEETPMPMAERSLYIPSAFQVDNDKKKLAIKLLSFLFASPTAFLRDAFKPLSYIGPLRKIPERNFGDYKNKPSEIKDWSDGLEAYKVLFRSDQEMLKKINSWLDHKHLDLNYFLQVKTIKEIDKSIGDYLDATKGDDDYGSYGEILEEPWSFFEDLHNQFSYAPKRQAITLWDQKKDIPVFLPDIGVGISQVLPIVIACIYMKQTAITPHCPCNILIFEQPELHLHPKLQCELGDLFIFTVNDKKGQVVYPQFIIESHSEHILLRLLRRIRETKENTIEPGITKLNSSDIAVYYIGQETTKENASQAKISHLRIDETGEFLDEWPKGFFEERDDELRSF